MRLTIRPAVTACAVALPMAALLGCGSGTDSTAPTPAPVATAANKVVDATTSFTFAPPAVSVTAGDTVTFAFSALQHNVFFDSVPGAPANITGSNVSINIPRVFATPGTYRYTCHIHPSMVGTVTVAAR